MPAATHAGPAGPPLSRAPIVGVTPCLDLGQRLRPPLSYLYVHRAYAEALAAAAASPVVLCPGTEPEVYASLCDALVLSGGGDLPERLGGAAFEDESWAGRVPGEPEALERIQWERGLLDAFAARGKPVLGVCFGMQLLNLHFGGTLHTDLRRAGALDHGGGGRSTRHGLSFSSDSPWRAAGLSGVSSSHRQGVAEVAPGFVVTAWAPDGLVEAIERPGLIGVEWHPESDESSAVVYSRLVALARGER